LQFSSHRISLSGKIRPKLLLIINMLSTGSKMNDLGSLVIP